MADRCIAVIVIPSMAGDQAGSFFCGRPRGHKGKHKVRLDNKLSVVISWRSEEIKYLEVVK